MALRQYKPTLPPAFVELVLIDRSRSCGKVRPVKTLTEGKNHSKGGRNNHRPQPQFGIRGGGHKQSLPQRSTSSDANSTCRQRWSGWNTIPNRTAFIALIKYQDGEFAYILAPQRLAVGDTVVSGEKVDVKPGNAMPLGALPVGTIVHNIEMKPGKGGQVARSAGTYAQYLGRDAGYALMRLNSGEVRKIPLTCMATVGAVSNPDHMNEIIGKAGRNVWKGKRPHVRGTAMNPIDHPHGGGEGRTKGGRHPVTPWGKPTKGAKTRKNKRTTKFIVRTRKGKAQG